MNFWESPVELARVLGLIVPLLVALITNKYADSALKSVLNVALSAVAGVTAFLVGTDGGWDWGGFFNAWFNAFVVGIVAYYGALKPMGIAPAVADKSDNFGIGGQHNEGGTFRLHPVWIALIVVAAFLFLIFVVL